MANLSEYKYLNGAAANAHSYILPAISKLLPRERFSDAAATLIDLGCGNGTFLRTCATPDSRWKLYGIDGSVSGIEQAEKTLPGVDLRWGDLSGCFDSHPAIGICDFVVSTEVVEHMYDPRAFARNCFAFLKPGGVAIVSTPYHGYLKNLVLAASGKMDRHFTALWDCGHIKFWSRKTLSQLLEEQGFVITKFQGVGRIPWLWKSMILVAKRVQ